MMLRDLIKKLQAHYQDQRLFTTRTHNMPVRLAISYDLGTKVILADMGHIELMSGERGEYLEISGKCYERNQQE